MTKNTSRYNLVDEPWISILTLDGENKQVSLKELFENAQDYYSLAGETETQNFAILRLLLAITHTVFSRYDANGNILETIKVDDRMRQVEEVSEAKYKEHEDLLYNTWYELWDRGYFPKIIGKYLDCWHDRFFLFSEENPFYQVTEKSIRSYRLKKEGQVPTKVFAKQINRTISESENKTALFSPRSESKNNKNIMTEAELVRWLITFQGYSGTSDKRVYQIAEEKTGSKGWIYDIGGIYLTGQNLFETLMLNTVIDHTEYQYKFKLQSPCWEYTDRQMLKYYLEEGPKPDNLAELYTNWSRAIYISPNVDMKKQFSFEIVKLPEISHIDNFLEPMTLWQFNRDGANRNKYTPRKHKEHESLWRSFGTLAWGENNRQVGIIEWYKNLNLNKNPSIKSVTMLDDKNATSWMPVGQVSDQIDIDHEVGKDLSEKGWIDRISEQVILTQEIIDKDYERFVDSVVQIRFSSSKNGKKPQKSQTQNYLNKAYFAIDEPFKEWLASIKKDDKKEETIKFWKQELKKIIEIQVQDFMENASSIDYIGREKKGKLFNITMAYEIFRRNINKKLQ